MMVETAPVRTMPWSEPDRAGVDPLLSREWIVTNGLGGYASGTLAGVGTRRYHGLLVAALPAPLGRTLMLNHLSERLSLPDGTSARLGGQQYADRLALHGHIELIEFRLEAGLPCWRYRVGGIVLEKRLMLPHRQNTSHIEYRLVEGEGTVRLRLRPSLNIRPHDAPVSTPLPAEPYALVVRGDRYEVDAGPELPRLRLYLRGQRASMTVAPGVTRGLFYRVEARRGYAESGDLWSPGEFRIELRPDRPVTLTASVEDWPTVLALPPAEAFEAERERRRRLIAVAEPAAREGVGAELVLAADQFLIRPVGRTEDAARASAAGEDIRTVIAGYHWFTDWGRDTMISLEGLTLVTGRHREAGDILRTFAHHVRDGLIPNLFPEGQNEGLYHTADATLWFFHALDRYLRYTGDRETLHVILPKLLDIVDHHLRGTRFGIGIDPADGLFRQGAEGYQLTWMDAKVEGWVVTPRRGKAVELNALWYNALKLLEPWARDDRGDAAADEIAGHAERARASFNRRFWNESANYLFDVVDAEAGGNDPAIRPNALFAVALDHPVLDPARWPAVLEVARQTLLTPVGLRSLAPGHPDYKPTYDGDLRARDAAYHQGTVWSWLIGPYVDAYLKVHPDDRAGARAALEGLVPHLGEAGMGTVSEIFDAEPPYHPRGCIAQAWGVAEMLRGWVKTAAGS